MGINYSIHNIRNSMFKTRTEPSSPKSTSSFKERANMLLFKIEGVHGDIEESKTNKFKELLTEMTSVEENVNQEMENKKKIYESLL